MSKAWGNSHKYPQYEVPVSSSIQFPPTSVQFPSMFPLICTPVQCTSFTASETAPPHSPHLPWRSNKLTHYLDVDLCTRPQDPKTWTNFGSDKRQSLVLLLLHSSSPVITRCVRNHPALPVTYLLLLHLHP